MKKTLAALTLTCATSLVGATESTVSVKTAASSPAALGPEANFTGRARVTSPFQSDGRGRASGATVTFEAGARTAWHTHPHGQILVVIAGVGLVQQSGQPAQAIRPGDVVNIPAGARHWHGAGPDGPMSHVAMAEKQAGNVVTWAEKVADDAYEAAAVAAGLRTGSKASASQSRAQQLMGDVAPKLAELTDQVLFGDIWQRPGLSPRDRSLVTVSALIAMNRPDQLKSHMTLALTNGVTQPELIEAVTHLAFYAGWPSAVTATGVARDVFAGKP